MRYAAVVLLLRLLLGSAIAHDAAFVPAEKLAADLVAAQSEEARAALLAASGTDRGELLRALIAESERSRLTGDFSRTGIAAELALRIANESGKQEWIADGLLQAGVAAYSREQYDAALESFQKSLEIKERIGDSAGGVRVLTLIGTSYRQKGDYVTARQYLGKSLAASQTPGMEKQLSAVLNALCLMDQDENHLEKADEECGKSLALRRQAADPVDLVEILMSSGRLKYFEGHNDDAVQLYKECLDLAMEHGYKYRIGYINSNLGDVYLVESKYVQALEAYGKALETSEAIGSHRLTAWVLLRIGEIHDTQSNYDVAMQYAQEALDLFQKVQVYKIYPARAQELVGRILLHQGRKAEALAWYEKSLKTLGEIDAKIDMAYQYNELGRAESRGGNLGKAVQYFLKALQLAEAANSKYVQALALNELGHTALQLKQYQAALDYSSRAAGYAGDSGNYNILWESLQVVGQAYAGVGDVIKARQSLDQSVAIVEDLRGEVAGGEEDRERFLSARMGPYRAMIDLLLAQKNIPEAFAFAERAKARVLFEALRANKTEPSQFMTAQEKTTEQEQADRMAALNIQILNESRKVRPDEKQLADLNQQLQEVRSNREASLANLYAAHPELRMQRGEIPALTPAGAAAVVPDSGTAVLEYVVTESKTYLFVLTKDDAWEPQLFTINLTRENLAKKVEGFRESLAALNLNFKDASRELYRILIQPAEAELRSRPNLLIVPDAELWNLPFAALQTPGNRFLLENHVLIEVPSLAALGEMRKALEGRGKETPNLLAFGNPTAAAASVRSVKDLYRDAALSPLPDAETEVNRLAQIYGPSRSAVYVRAEAREDRFKTEAPKYRVLHIASHGILNDTAPLYSQLVLAPGMIPGSEDGLLEAWEIMNLKLNADLAVLSACETGRGRIGSGEGMIGLSWALLVAGVPTTVVSQWKVESKSTTDLMVRFHKAFVSSDPAKSFRVAAALQQAALQVLAQPAYRHPFYWAGFVVVGAGN